MGPLAVRACVDEVMVVEHRLNLPHKNSAGLSDLGHYQSVKNGASLASNAMPLRSVPAKFWLRSMDNNLINKVEAIYNRV
jgi:hypothetical protein